MELDALHLVVVILKVSLRISSRCKPEKARRSRMKLMAVVAKLPSLWSDLLIRTSGWTGIQKKREKGFHSMFTWYL